jgi:hypothetical protein
VSTAPQRREKTVSEARNIAIDFTGKLDAGELLTGTPTVVEIVTADLTLSNKAINTSAKTINGVSVATGMAVLFKAAGGEAGRSYRIQITVTTNASPAQTLVENVILKVIADSD